MRNSAGSDARKFRRAIAQLLTCSEHIFLSKIIHHQKIFTRAHRNDECKFSRSRQNYLKNVSRIKLHTNDNDSLYRKPVLSCIIIRIRDTWIDIFLNDNQVGRDILYEVVCVIIQIIRHYLIKTSGFIKKMIAIYPRFLDPHLSFTCHILDNLIVKEWSSYCGHSDADVRVRIINASRAII